MNDRPPRHVPGRRAATKPNLALFRRAMKELKAETPVQIADLLGYNETSIRRLLNGEHKVSLGLLKELKKHVGLAMALRICNLADEAELHEMQAA